MFEGLGRRKDGELPLKRPQTETKHNKLAMAQTDVWICCP